MKSWSNFQSLLYFEDKMAFWKSHADPVSWWSCRPWHLRINTEVPCSEGRSTGNSVSCALSCQRAGSSRPCERTIFMLRPSTTGNTPMRRFTASSLMIVFLLITCGFKFSSLASWTDPLWPMCCLVLEPSFLEFPGFLVCNFAVLPCVKSSVAQLRKCSPLWEAANMVFLFMYYA